MPGSGERATRREPSREAARRQAVDTLKVAWAIAAYAARWSVTACPAEDARRAVVQAAAELERAAASCGGWPGRAAEARRGMTGRVGARAGRSS